MDAEVLLVSAEGKRAVPVKDFFTGPQKTVRKPGELIVEIRVPLQAGKAVFEKLGLRKAQTCSLASAAARLIAGGHRTIVFCRSRKGTELVAADVLVINLGLIIEIS